MNELGNIFKLLILLLMTQGGNASLPKADFE